MDIINKALSFFQPKEKAITDYSPEEQNAIAQVRAKDPNTKFNNQQIIDLYHKNGSNLWNGNTTPSPTTTPMPGFFEAIGRALHSDNPFSHPQAAQAQEQMPTPTPYQAPNTPVPTGIQVAMDYLKQKSGGQDPTAYYKALQDPNFLPKIQQADKIKPGLGNLLLMQAFNESTLGNANNGNNIFGALPGGEGSGNHAAFNSPSEAVDYQLGPHVLGGGANPNMDIVHDKNPLTFQRIVQLYKSYNPSGDYLQPMIQAMQKK